MATPDFGDPNAQPSTPKQTPTSAGFPTSVFETPKNHRASFEDSSGWTPRFAEEYSVFNSTPGNLRGSQAPFADFSVSTPYQSSNHKRPLSAENIAAEIATHVTHFSPNPNLPLPPVDPTRRLQSSPGSLVTGQSPTEPGFGAGSQQLPKKQYQDSAQGAKTQTATPPPSTHKGQRRLAPKLQTGTMQNEGFEQEFIAGTPQQQHVHNSMSTPTDLFGYPMSAPATAPGGFGDSHVFWDPDMNGMDIDFTAGGGHMFQTPGHRPVNSLDWAKSNELFQETGTVPPQQSQESNAPARKERVLAPKPPAQSMDTSAADTSMFASSFPASADEPFNMNQNGGVDPGLLFTRPPSSGMEPAPFDPMSQPPLMQSFSQPEPITLAAKPTKRGAVRRTGSAKQTAAGKKAVNRASASSPIKPSGRPGLSRSFSEKISRKPAGGANLPNLTPATRPVSQSSARSVSQGSARSNGRISPLKNHNHRLSSLSSIPETPRPRTQTSVKFTIDSKGRARAETTTVVVDEDDEDEMPTVRRRREHHGKERSWASSENDDSSTDDEPIIIPSRNTSFVLPQPQNPSAYTFHSSQRSVSDQSTSSLGIYYNGPEHAVEDPESEAETVMNLPGSSNVGDAASELRKLVEIFGGDHCGPEVVAEAVKVIKAVESSSPSAGKFNLQEHLLGGCSINAHGTPLTDEALKAAQAADAVLLGAIGGPEWGTGAVRPEQGILRLRKEMQTYGNLRPCFFPSDSLVEFSPLKADVCRGTNFTVVRELTGGIYFGERKEADLAAGDEVAWDTELYSRAEIQRITRLAAHLALASDPPAPVWSLDKANVLATSRLWRKVVTETMAAEFPQLKIQHQLIDSAAMIMVKNPRGLNGIVVTSNLFGDIVSDEASVIPGSIGLSPSASLSGIPDGKSKCNGIYEPIHGSAPDISGKGIVNPIGTILSVAMMFRYSFALPKEADAIEAAVKNVIDNGVRTKDMGGSAGTKEVGEAVVAELSKILKS
ncbi:Isocitrate/isopropylmalate dehydrogenase-domain-containing protein [Hypoxylon sp. FL1284]|nr:Isocitrate/isopropylmalate dehydrogenase-domain-containing protein [Hypoxylon sp. FL1284]